MKPSPAQWRPTPRPVLLVIAIALVAHCALLGLVYRAVPADECLRICAAVVFALLCASIQGPRSGTRSLRPLGAPSGMRRGLVRFVLGVSGLVSFVLPWVLILVSNDVAVVRVLGPQLFVFASQQLFEIWSYRANVSIVLRLIIPVAFVGYRLRVIAKWIAESASIENAEVARAARGLGIANAAFCTFVLFYVLLIKVCPPYFGAPRASPQKSHN